MIRPPRSKAQIAAWVCVTLAALPMPWLVVRQPDNRLLLGIWRDGKTEDYVAGWRSVDEYVGRIPSKRNIAIIFRHFDSSLQYDTEIAEQAAHRSAYAIYPRRLYVSWDGRTVGGGKDVIDGKFEPDLAWLQAHDVSHFIIYSLDSTGRLSLDTTEVPPPSPVNVIRFGGQ